MFNSMASGPFSGKGGPVFGSGLSQALSGFGQAVKGIGDNQAQEANRQQQNNAGMMANNSQIYDMSNQGGISGALSGNYAPGQQTTFDQGQGNEFYGNPVGPVQNYTQWTTPAVQGPGGSNAGNPFGYSQYNQYYQY